MQAAKLHVNRNSMTVMTQVACSMVTKDWRSDQSLLIFLKLVDFMHIVEPHKRDVRGPLGLHRMDPAGYYKTLEPWSVQGMHDLINSHSIACNVHVACSSLLLSMWQNIGRLLCLHATKPVKVR